MNAKKYLLRMTLFLLIVVGGAAFLFSSLKPIFFSNVGLNATILTVIVLSIAFTLFQVLQLHREVEWVKAYRLGRPRAAAEHEPRLLSPLATILGDQNERLSLSAPVSRSLLDGVEGRLHESRELGRYFVGLLVFLGLLGTFWGLSKTIASISSTITSLPSSGVSTEAFFETLKESLRQPLSGMGTAFSSSLFGLAGSLIVGFLELQVGQAHAAFYHDLEEWLSSMISLEAEKPVSSSPFPAYVEGLLGQTAENMEALQRQVAQAEQSRVQFSENLMVLVDRVGRLTDQMRTEQNLLVKLAEGQMQLQSLLNGGMPSADESWKHSLRAIERLLQDISDGRHQQTSELRNEIRIVAKTLAAAANQDYGAGE